MLLSIFNLKLQRSLQLSPELLATTRQSRLHRSNTYFKGRGDFLVRETLDVPENNGLAVDPTQATQCLSQGLFSFVGQSVLFRITRAVCLQRGDERLPAGIIRGIKRDCRISPPPTPPP